MHVDLNADIGELEIGHDEALLTCITSGSIACGVHAGNPALMRRTVRLAADAGVAIGAHPGFDDRAGFGRREVDLSPADITDLVLAQIAALNAIARAEGVRLQHVKPHGAMYNMSVRRVGMAEAVARAVAASDETLLLFAPPGSELLAAGRRLGLQVAAEGFADRLYEPDGSLTSRGVAGALLTDPALAARQAVRMVSERRVVARDASSFSLTVDTICVHGDTAEAVAIATAVRHALERADIAVEPLKCF
ncbi:MAG: LamB/YcsF family protein [Vicinamibacterales bacterium]|nr:LamB/YcsF family protein [Vicinamibacterales bacterium]